MFYRYGGNNMSQSLFEKDFLSFFLSMGTNTPPKVILKEIHNFVYKYFPVKLSSLFLYEDKTSEYITFPKLKEVARKKMFFSQDIISLVQKDNKPVMRDDHELFDSLDGLKRNIDFDSVLLLPLQEESDFLGILSFFLDGFLELNKNLENIFRVISKFMYLLLKNKYYYNEMEQRLAELLTLQTVSDFVNSTLDFEKLLDISLDAIVGLIGLRTCSITVFTDKLFNDIYTRKQNSLVNTIKSSQEIEIDLSKGIYSYISKKKTSISGIAEVDDEIISLLPSLKISKGEKIQYIILPITRGHDLFGFINIFDPTLIHLDNIESHFLESFTNQFSIALQNANLYRKQEEMARKDGLTSLYNHAYFQNRLDLLIKEKSMQPLSLIIMDIDDFKRVNDYYGHLTGDKVLKELSSILLRYTREGDLVARYGGEEFAILLPNTAHQEALNLAQRLNKKIENNRILLDNNKPLSITVSIGVTEYSEGWSKKKFIEKVDQLLYLAKNNGKNRVETT